MGCEGCARRRRSVGAPLYGRRRRLPANHPSLHCWLHPIQLHLHTLASVCVLWRCTPPPSRAWSLAHAAVHQHHRVLERRRGERGVTTLRHYYLMSVRRDFFFRAGLERRARCAPCAPPRASRGGGARRCETDGDACASTSNAVSCPLAKLESPLLEQCIKARLSVLKRGGRADSDESEIVFCRERGVTQ